jgi:hypothetical protein
MSRDVILERVDPVHVLAVRRKLSGQGEICEAIAALRPSVVDVLSGPPICLSLGFPRDGKLDVELAFPTRELIDREGFVTKTLPSLPMFSITHIGPLEGGPDGTNLEDTRKKLVQFVRDRALLAGDDPERFIYHEGFEIHGDREESYVTEIQCPYHLPIWLTALEQGTARVAGRDAARRVMAGSQGLAEALAGARAAEWVRGAMERLDREVGDERDRACIMNACAHHYIVQSGMLLEEAFRSVGGDLRKLIEKINAETLLGSKYWIDETGPEPLLVIERRPARQAAYDQATDPAEKRYQACFCPLVRGAIRKGEKVSRTFCHCSGGWYVQEWEIVFGERPEVRLIQTMLEGADACVFAVVIPPGKL